MTQTPYLSRTQQALSKLVTETVGHKWQSYDASDRAAAQALLQRYIATAPETLSSRDYQKMLEGKKHKRTKDFVVTLFNSMDDKIWKYLD